MARKWVLVLLGTVLAAVRTGGRSTGAPTDACDTFTPMHYGNSAQSGDGGFKLYSDLIDNGGSFAANQAYNITLRNEDGATTFKGFLIGARAAGSGARIGTFSTPAGSQHLDCAPSFLTDDTTVTHTSNSDKESVMLTWTAPGLSVTVKFRYAVVVSYSTFYADLELPMAMQPAPSFSFQLPGTFSFNIPSTFTNPVPQPSPTVMVPDCPATDKMEDSEFPLTFRQPAGCDRQSCDVYAAMGPNAANGDFLDIYLEGTAVGWVAVGFSKDTSMNHTDVVGCRISSGEVNVRDAWNSGQINEDDEFPEDGVCTHSASYSGGRISCLISKYGMKVEDTQDFNLKDGSYWIITGIRTNGQLANSRFSKHSSTPTFSTAQYSPFSDSNADEVIVTDSPIVCPTAPGADQNYNIEVGLPPGCTKDNCTYYVALGPNADNSEYLDVYLQGTVEGWVAVGFSHTQMMGDSDVLGCKVVNGEASVVDSWNYQGLNTLDGDQEGVCVHSSSYSDGVISCSFSRHGAPASDSDDLQLNADLWLLFGARTNAQVALVPSLAKHTSIPIVSDQMYNPFTNEVTLSPTTATSAPITCPSAPNQDYNLEVGLPHGCVKDDCTYYLAMGPNAEDGEFLDVYLQGTVEGWVAIGFSHTQMMGDSDVLGCKVVNGEASAVDSWNYQAANALDSDQEGVCVHSSSYSDGVISCSFSRHGPPGSDSDDLQLNDDLWLLFGAKTEAQLTFVPSLAKHTSTPIISDQMYNPFTSEGTLSPTTATSAPFTCPSAPNQDYILEFGLPQGCVKDNCTYYVAMGPNAEDGEYLDVYLQGTVQGWVAVGFSQDQMMGDSDVLGCKVVDDEASVVDTWNFQQYNTLDGDQGGLCVYSSSYSNGVISCSFSRLGGDGSDSEDLRLNDDLWLIFGSKVEAQPSLIQGLRKHTSTPVFSDKEYNPFTSKRKITPMPMANITCPSSPASDAVFPVETTFDDDFYFAARINDENPNFLDMIIEASSEGWIAIGFSTTRQMAETDVFACQLEPSGSVVNVKDGWNPLPNRAANQLDSTQAGICKHDATYQDGAIKCKFSRYISPLNSETDLNLNDNLYRMYAKGNTRDLATSSLAKHESTPAVTDDTANVVTAAAAGENIQESVYPEVELIQTHGILMLFSWPLLATNAIFFASWLKPALPNGEWFQVHRAVMIISLITTLIGFIMAFVANAKKSVPGLIDFDSSGVNTTHFVFGITITLLHIVNPIIALFRCKPGAKWRWIFNISHAGIIGFGAQILAMVNVCLGLWLLEQSHRGFYVFIVFFALFLVTEVAMFILTSFLATRKGVPQEEMPNLVHSSVKFCLRKSEPAPETTMDEAVEMEEKNGLPSFDEDNEQKKKKKKPSSDARIRWASFGLFLGMSVVVFIVVVILVLLD